MNLREEVELLERKAKALQKIHELDYPQSEPKQVQEHQWPLFHNLPSAAPGGVRNI